MKSSASAGVSFLLALVAGCAPKPAAPPPPPDAAAIRTALDRRVEQLMVTLKDKDVAGLTSNFTEDATWVLPDASTFKGRADIEQAAKAFFGTYESVTLGPATIDQLIDISDTEALTFSNAAYTITMKGKQPENHTNPFADYWKKGADGVWRVAYEVNADGVVPAGAAAKKP